MSATTTTGEICTARDSLAEEGACDACPRGCRAGANQVRLEFWAGAHSAILGTSARTVLGHDLPPAVNRCRGTARCRRSAGRPRRAVRVARARCDCGNRGSAMDGEGCQPGAHVAALPYGANRRTRVAGTGSAAYRTGTARGVPWHVPNTGTRAKDRQSWLSRSTWAAPRRRKARSHTTKQTHSASPLAAFCSFSDSILEHRRISRSSRQTPGFMRKSSRSDRVRRNPARGIPAGPETDQDSITADPCGTAEAPRRPDPPVRIPPPCA